MCKKIALASAGIFFFAALRRHHVLSDFAGGFGGGVGLLNTAAAVAGFFAAFGFLGSRPLRFWPLAIALSYGSHGVGTGISVMNTAKHTTLMPGLMPLRGL